MSFKIPICVSFFTICCFSIPCFAHDLDFFYFVQQWPGAYCDTTRGCCYPKIGKLAENFTIHGLWPNYNDGSYPQSCSRDSQFNQTHIWDLVRTMNEEWPSLNCPGKTSVKFWRHEWMKHGTCTLFSEHSYFKAALDLKNKVNLLQIFKHAGIEPDGREYDVREVYKALEAAGLSAYIDCNADASRKKQLYQVYLCVDKSGSDFIKCPVLPKSKSCAINGRIEFPTFEVSISSVAVV